ncbi:MAG: hypothetical protein QXR42_05770 [Candidatus Bathyarchaeia archaeon]
MLLPWLTISPKALTSYQFLKDLHASLTKNHAKIGTQYDVAPLLNLVNTILVVSPLLNHLGPKSGQLPQDSSLWSGTK